MRRVGAILAAGAAMLASLVVLAPPAAAGYQVVMTHSSTGWHIEIENQNPALFFSYDGLSTTLEIRTGRESNGVWDVNAVPACTQDTYDWSVSCDTSDSRVHVTMNPTYADGGSATISAAGEPIKLWVTTLSGPDRISAGDKQATISSGKGDDIVTGGSAADTIDAGAGDDYVSGGAAADTIGGGGDVDRLFGDAGLDTLRAKDGTRDDAIDCGSGKDTAESATHDPTDPKPVSC